MLLFKERWDAYCFIMNIPCFNLVWQCTKLRNRTCPAYRNSGDEEQIHKGKKEMNDLVMKCMSLDKAKRAQSMDELRLSLEKFL